MESSAKYVKIPGMSDKGTEFAANGAPQATENSITTGQNDALIVAKDVTYSYRNGEQVSRGVKGVDLEIRGGEFVVVLDEIPEHRDQSETRRIHRRDLSGPAIQRRVLPVEIQSVVALHPGHRGLRLQEFRSAPLHDRRSTAAGTGIPRVAESVPRDEIEERVTEALETVGMESYRTGSPNRLSGGQKQRIAIAAILAMRPKAIVLDESTAMLDPKGRREIMDTILKLQREKGMAVVLITHYMDEAIAADKIHIMNDGEIIASGTPRKVFQNEAAIQRAGLELPVAAKVALNLKKAGLYRGFALNDEELAEEVAVALTEEKCESK